jgi:branched-subunit amino acid aminotransferase/4-amino-4-deoxychorismate lyase
VRSVVWQRELPQIKHVGTFGLFAERRAAMAEGFDDVLFVTADGDVSEGSTWNLAVHDGERLLWPQAPALRGTAETLLKQHWPGPQVTRPLALAELDGVKAALPATPAACGRWTPSTGMSCRVRRRWLNRAGRCWRRWLGRIGVALPAGLGAA